MLFARNVHVSRAAESTYMNERMNAYTQLKQLIENFHTMFREGKSNVLSCFVDFVAVSLKK